jgi:hypothetical protein
MPEGPEMRRAADELAAVLAGRLARDVWFKFPQLARWGRALSGRRVRGVEARGKALILHFAGGTSVYTHNQLYGKWLVGPAGRRPETARDLRLAIETRTHAARLSHWGRDECVQGGAAAESAGRELRPVSAFRLRSPECGLPDVRDAGQRAARDSFRATAVLLPDLPAHAVSDAGPIARAIPRCSLTRE